MAEELAKLQAALGEQQYAQRRFDTASQILDQIISSDDFVEFLTLPAYQYLS
jgi:malate synthase